MIAHVATSDATMEVSIREMKNSLSKYLKRVQAGERILITDRGRPVAQLTAVAQARPQQDAEYLRRALSLPWVRPGKGGRVKGAGKPIPLRPGEKPLSELVARDRD